MFIVSFSFDDLVNKHSAGAHTRTLEMHTETNLTVSLNMNVFSCSNNVIPLVGSGVTVHAKGATCLLPQVPIICLAIEGMRPD